MKRLLIASAAFAGAFALAGAAAAQDLDGTITIEGSVGAKCSAVGAFGETVDLGELAGANGQLASGLSLTRTYSVICNGANVGVSIDATSLENETVLTAPTGYARVIAYVAQVDINTVENPGSAADVFTLTDDSGDAAESSGSLGAGVFVANSAGNITISADTFDAGTDLLIAGDYSAEIVVTLTPS